ncbi:MAG: VWA domain-containing protein, partial [Flavobacteriales bacterium]|nr:VWA domain-containing protein [Flavobacteriales bacterium]
EEERELTVMLLVDVSGSKEFGTQHKTKQELATEICAVLAFSAINNNDKVGVIFFSDKIEKFIPPKKGRSHILMIIRDLIDFEPESKGTDISMALKYFNNVIKKRCTAFLLSDFVCHTNFENAIKIANRKHDLIALRLYDRAEEELPNIGLVPMLDAETNSVQWVNTSSKTVQKEYKIEGLKRKGYLKSTFKKGGIDNTNIGTHEDYVKPLMALFKRRGAK